MIGGPRLSSRKEGGRGECLLLAELGQPKLREGMRGLREELGQQAERERGGRDFLFFFFKPNFETHFQIEF